MAESPPWNRLILVRHGQASFSDELNPDYDRLSPRGREQAEVLARHWITSGLEFDRVFAGPLRRQRETAEAVCRVFAEYELPLPELRVIEDLDEHQGPGVMMDLLPGLARREDELGELARGLAAAQDGRARLYLKIFRRVVRLWAGGELATEHQGRETWGAFRRRVERTVREIAAELEPGSTAVAFSSGGALAAVAGWALELDDLKTLELSWIVQNCATLELFCSPSRISLKSFNCAAPLEAAGIVTYL